MQIRRSESFLSFKNSLLKIGQPAAKPTYSIHNHIGLKFLIRLRLGLSHLSKHKFKLNFQDCVISLRSCSLEIESFPISFCTAIISQTYVQPSQMICSQLMEISQVFQTMNWWIYFFMEVLTLTSIRTTISKVLLLVSS